LGSAILPPMRPEKLSPRRWKRVLWTLSHPVLDFLFVHHRAASLAVAAVVLALVLWWLFTYVGHGEPLRIFWVTPANPTLAE
jgi:hypothetical protein